MKRALILSIIAGVILGGGYVFLQANNPKDVLFSNWKTFRSGGVFDFQIKTPREWTVKVGEESPDWLFNSSKEDQLWVEVYPAPCSDDIAKTLSATEPDQFINVVCKNNFVLVTSVKKLDPKLDEHKKILSEILYNFKSLANTATNTPEASTTDWKIFSVPEWGIEFRAPSDFEVRLNDGGVSPSDPVWMGTDIAEVLKKSDITHHAEFIHNFLIWVQRQPLTYKSKIYDNSYDAAINFYNKNQFPGVEISQVSLNGYDATKISNVQDPEGMATPEMVYWVYKNGFIYEISWFLDYPEFTEIAKSLKFTR